ncbi:hypothetical protein LTR08_001533 [Meristemomyces frigidus]|nr:hypothetical protein LTR08_001533 [Meristemomyces frigidus]
MTEMRDDTAPLEAQAQPMEHFTTAQGKSGASPCEHYLPAASHLLDKPGKLDHTEARLANLQHGVPLETPATDSFVRQPCQRFAQTDPLVDGTPSNVEAPATSMKPSVHPASELEQVYSLPDPLNSNPPPHDSHHPSHWERMFHHEQHANVTRDGSAPATTATKIHAGPADYTAEPRDHGIAGSKRRLSIVEMCMPHGHMHHPRSDSSSSTGR